VSPEIAWSDPVADWPGDDLEHRNVIAQAAGGAVIRGRLRKDGEDWIVQPLSGPGVRLVECSRWRLT
jgi:hypothetical protein